MVVVVVVVVVVVIVVVVVVVVVVLGHRFGWGPHRFAYPSHPCRGSGPFLINLLALNSDGGSYESTFNISFPNNFS